MVSLRKLLEQELLQLYYKGEEIVINDFKTGELTQKLYDTLTGIQWGRLEDKYGWVRYIK